MNAAWRISPKNQAESLFSRFRRMQIGQHHHFGLAHLANYANEAAYREDTRRWSNGEIFSDILTKCARTRPHRDWSGYWQGNTRRPERLAARAPHARTQARPPPANSTARAAPFPVRRRSTARLAPFARPNRAEVVRRGEQPDRRVQMPQLRRQPLQFLVTQLRLPGQLAPLHHQCAHYV